MNGYVVGMGEALWDVLPEGRKIGGAPANFACHISQFGLAGRIVSAVGDDPLGDELLDGFRRRNLEGLIEKVAFPTGTVQVELDAAGIPRYDIRRDVAWDNIPFTPELEALAHETRAVCFGSLAQRSEVSRRTIGRFLDAMPAGEGRYRIFDINLRQEFYTEELILDSLRRCDILKINDEELAAVGRMFDLPQSGMQEQCRELVERHALDMLILTCGVDGSYVFTPEAVSFVGTPRVEVADTVGAGDSFTATFVAAILYGKPVCEAHRLAVEASAYVCTQQGAMPRFPAALIERVCR